MSNKANMSKMLLNQDYIEWLKQLKSEIRSTQIKAAIAINSTLIDFYFALGKMIAEKTVIWGSKLLETLSADLKKEFPDMQGFSITNLKYCRLFYNYAPIRPQVEDELENSQSPQAGDILNQLNNNDLYQQIRRIPWGHIKLLIGKIKENKEAKFYIYQTIENGWSRDVLALQIKSNLFKRQGKAVTNFKKTLPGPQSDLAQQTIKDPYAFDFLTMTQPYNERDVELKLIEHISKFLLELGKGFAFVGRQYHLEVDESDYYIDLLFYHTKYFYLSAVDSLVKAGDDNPTIGILLCRNKKKIETEFALRGVSQPIGVSEFTLTEELPDNLKGSLPTVGEIEAELEEKESNE